MYYTTKAGQIDLNGVETDRLAKEYANDHGRRVQNSGY